MPETVTLCPICGFEAVPDGEPCDDCRHLAAEQDAPTAEPEPHPELCEWLDSIRRVEPNWLPRPPAPVDFAAWDAVQQRAVDLVFAAADRGVPNAVGCAPTGYGKTRVAELLIAECVRRRWPWVFYTHRKSLFEQTHKRFLAAGIQHGCRASEFWRYEFLDRPGQLAMIPSEQSAVKQSGKRQYHEARLCIWDEAHANKAGFAEELFRHHEAQGAFQLGLTATPVGLGHLYKELLMFGWPTQMRKIGALVPADIYAPDEVDLKNVGRSSVSWEFNQKELGSRFAIHKVACRVIDHWFQYNPQARPTLLFAPGVKESMWFVDQFIEAGVAAAHIDGEDVYLGQKDTDGEPIVYGSSQNMRGWVERMHREGRISVVCNRFVFLMGVDWPWIEHVCFATSFGTLEMWIQAVGRGLRACEGKTRCIVQDHGGNWHRHSSPNADITWRLSDTNQSIAAEQKAKRESGDAQEPKLCPSCAKPMKFEVWSIEKKCAHCGFAFTHSVRAVIQSDGTLRKMKGTVVKKKAQGSDVQRVWDKLYFPSSKSKRPHASTFTQLKARFEKQMPNHTIGRGADGQTVVFGPGGDVHVLGNAPRWESVLWKDKVRGVPRQELQWSKRD